MVPSSGEGCAKQQSQMISKILNQVLMYQLLILFCGVVVNHSYVPSYPHDIVCKEEEDSPLKPYFSSRVLV